MLGVFKPAAEKALRPVAYQLRHVNPNAITLLGLLFPVLFFILVVNGLHWAALAVFVLNGVDMLDGLVARSQNKVTAFGGFLDSTVDRFADFVVLVAFGFAGIVRWEIVLTLVLLSYLISYIRSRTELAAQGKLVANVGIIERTERLLAVFVGLALHAAWPGVAMMGLNLASVVFVLLILLSAVTVAQRVAFAYDKL